MSSSQTRSLRRGRVLVLGGTAEARSLAARLVDDAIPVITSLAGRVSRPALPRGEVRIGGFGGLDGLVDFLGQNQIGYVVDATHPFAARISATAVAACAQAAIPLLRFARPGWANHADASIWTWVPDHRAAAAAVIPNARVLLTTGRQSIGDFQILADRTVYIRLVDEPTFILPPTWRAIISRGPYDVDDERALMQTHQIDTLITKDSGGAMTAGKLDAARDLGVQVIVVRRPDYHDTVATVRTNDEALSILTQ
ncbi:MAG: cobalt-precorrin-6A reductase [Antricoccus sp.]